MFFFTGSTVSSEKLIHTAFVGLGSNLGESKELLARAWNTLAEFSEISIVRLSSPYMTKPVDMESPHWFVNAAGELRTSLAQEALLTLLLRVEKQFGRTRDQHIPSHQDRTLDLDLLLYDTLVMTTDELTLPHPEMHKRLFVLVPMAEISPNLLHPVYRKTIAELRDELIAGTKNDEVQRQQWTDRG